MKDQLKSVPDVVLAPFDNNRLLNLCGRFDEHLKFLEKRLQVKIASRGNTFFISGEAQNRKLASQTIKYLYNLTRDKQKILSLHDVHLALIESGPDAIDKSSDPIDAEHKKASTSSLHTPMGIITARSSNQVNYIKNIHKNPINFGIGPAGTGKTFLAVACAVNALEQDLINRILLVRPAVEAGERLGFLPGDLAQKIDPYLRPLYDALYEMLGAERVAQLLEQQVIEIAPLAYMRGRTLNDAFIILDEGQNTTIEQMKMFLTRIGFSSTAVITGDITQVDLPKGVPSGLKHVIQVLENQPNISFNYLESHDTVRHPVVQQIIDAYNKFENKNSD